MYNQPPSHKTEIKALHGIWTAIAKELARPSLRNTFLKRLMNVFMEKLQWITGRSKYMLFFPKGYISVLLPVSKDIQAVTYWNVRSIFNILILGLGKGHFVT